MKGLMYSCLWCVLAGIAVSGCTQSAAWTETPTAQSEMADDTETKPSEKYNEYLCLMTDQERMEFFSQQSDEHRDRFLQAQGINQKKYLKDHLHVGMPQEKVEALKELGEPIKTEAHTTHEGRTVEWIYDSFNGYRRMRYIIVFRNNQVVNWDMWIP